MNLPTGRAPLMKYPRYPEIVQFTSSGSILRQQKIQPPLKRLSENIKDCDKQLLTAAIVLVAYNPPEDSLVEHRPQPQRNLRGGTRKVGKQERNRRKNEGERAGKKHKVDSGKSDAAIFFPKI